MNGQTKRDEPYAALSIEELTVNYQQTAVLWDINCAIPSQKLVAIIGPNGAGKSTLLKACMGLIKPSAGCIRFFGKPLAQIRDRVAYVPQRASVDWDFPITALDLVLMGCYHKLGVLKWISKQKRQTALNILKQLEMESFADRQISELSGGQQQRLFIARALMQQADIYLMDEPFAGIDIASEQLIADLFQQLRSQGKTLLIVHHDLESVERYFDWCVLLNSCIIAAGEIQVELNKQNIMRTYGRSSALLDSAAQLSKTKSSGMR